MRRLTREVPFLALALVGTGPSARADWKTHLIRFGDPLPISRPSGIAASAVPTALAAGDFDEDGMPDLVAGFGDGPEGSVAILRGDESELFSNRFVPAHGAPFLEGSIRSLPLRPDFLAAGDFDADGHVDLLAASRDRALLTILPGDGRRGFATPISIPLSSMPTALAAGEFDRRDGVPDVAVGLRDGSLLLFEGMHGVLRSIPERFETGAPPTDVVIGRFDSDPFPDVAVVSDGTLRIVFGRDRRLAFDENARGPVPEAVVTRFDGSGAIAAIAPRFDDSSARSEVVSAARSGRLERLAAVHPSGTVTGDRALPLRSLDRPIDSARLLEVRISTCRTPDLLLVTPGARELTVIPGCAAEPVANLPIGAPVVAVLPMRLNPDALSDLVVATADPSRPLVVIPTVPMATFTVNSALSTNDANLGNGICADSGGLCTFNAALQETNALAGADSISFSLGGIPVISGALPWLTDPVTVLGTTAGGGLVHLDQSAGFNVRGGSSVFRGLVISRTTSSGPGFTFGLASGSFVEGCRIGTDPTGATAMPNTNGITVQDSSNNMIGGTTAAARNLLSGNAGRGITLGITSGTGNTIAGNRIGTNLAGNGAVPNTLQGILLGACTDATVGGTASGAGNQISGNSTDGIYVDYLATGALIQQNYIGTAPFGAVAVPNGGMGIQTWISPTLTIGGATPSARNLVSGNLRSGLYIWNNSSTDLLLGNYVGVNALGSAAVPNGESGILIRSPGILTSGNLVSGNIGNGIEVGSGASQVIRGNLVGADSGATAVIPNTLNGIYLSGNNTQTPTIGGTGAGEGNLVCGNLGDGINLSATSGAIVQGNLIGTNYANATTLGNKGHGINVLSGMTFTFGGVAAGEANVIAYNSGIGVRLDSGVGTGISIRGNQIHSNGSLGIDLRGTGVSANDTGDGDAGPNGVQNFPVLTSVTHPSGNTLVAGTLNSIASKTFTVDFYGNSAIDPSGYGEGRFWLASTPVTTNASGNGSFSVPIAGVYDFISTTATDENGSTSEFSGVLSNPKEAAASGDLRATKGSGSSVTLTFTPAPCAATHTVFQGTGPIAGAVSWNAASCGVGATSPTSFDPGTPTASGFFYFVLVGQNAAQEGSYGRNSAGVEIPEATGIGSCDRPRVLTGSCP